MKILKLGTVWGGVSLRGVYFVVANLTFLWGGSLDELLDSDWRHGLCQGSRRSVGGADTRSALILFSWSSAHSLFLVRYLQLRK